MLDECQLKKDCAMFIKTNFSQGGFCHFDENMLVGNKNGFFGWMGLGGSVFTFHPEKKISFGYAMNLLSGDFSNGLGLELEKVAHNCV